MAKLLRKVRARLFRNWFLSLFSVSFEREMNEALQDTFRDFSL
jgi:hypothetical protein